MSDLFNKLVMRRKGRHLPHCLPPGAGEVVPHGLSLIASPSQVSLEKDLALAPVRGLVEPSVECQTPFHLCRPHSSQQETRTRMTGSPKSALALLPHQQEQLQGLLGQSEPVRLCYPRSCRGLCRCPRPVPKFSSWSRAM